MKKTRLMNIISAYFIALLIGWLPDFLFVLPKTVGWMLGYIGGLLVGFFIFQDDEEYL